MSKQPHTLDYASPRRRAPLQPHLGARPAMRLAWALMALQLLLLLALVGEMLPRQSDGVIVWLLRYLGAGVVALVAWAAIGKAFVLRDWWLTATAGVVAAGIPWLLPILSR